MPESDHFGVIVLKDRSRRSGKSVFRLYVKGVEHHDYPGVARKHAYIMPQASDRKEFDRQVNLLISDLAMLKLKVGEESDPGG